ncbi:MAG: glycoside hydrolase family 2 protein [Tenericutes bacterium]|nr:glycoside hydrolase family 2 protein [Mycoplasmatota bacterium]
MRKAISLNFYWDFIPDFKESYIGSKNIKNTEKVNIPHTMKEIPLNYFDEEMYQIIATYSKTIEIDEETLQNNLFIEFKAVMNVCKVYLNRELLIVHEGGYTPFTVDITDKALLGENLLQVIVDANEVKNVPPFGRFIDYLCFSGIYREVSLLVRPKVYIEQVHVATDEANLLKETEMIANVSVRIKQPEETEYMIKSTVLLDDLVIAENVIPNSIVTEQYYSQAVRDIKRWHPDTPVLYTLKIDLLENEVVIDTMSQKFGFRTVKFTPEGFLINNKVMKLIGLNRHQSYPYVGYAMPKTIQELDADILKDFGCNIVRTSHYMQSDHFLNRCDEIGLLVFEEIPGWQYIGDEHFKELTYQNIEVMINSHFNHPSIVTWGIRINESFDDHDFYTKTNELARELDPTRQTSGVRNTKKGEFLEDVYTYNDFSHTGENIGLEAVKNVVKGYKPYLVTEHNGHVFPTKKSDTDERRKEQSLRHTAVLDAAFSSKRYSGAIGWCLADYNTHFNFGSNDRICHHGVMDSFRYPKYAAYTYKAQKAKEAVLFVASNMIPGDYEEFKLPETIVYTNCDYIKVYKNDEFISDYYSDWENYPNIPNAPIIFDDYIGDLIVQSGEFSEKDAKKITKLLYAFYKDGFNMSLSNKLSYLSLLRRKIVDFKDLVRLAEKHIAMQQAVPTVFKIEGIIDDEVVITKRIGHTLEAILKATIDHSVLEHGYTYDATRVVVRMTDEFDNDLLFSNDVISIKVTDELELIGPNQLSLVAGSQSFYVKTKKLGKATITVKDTRNQEEILKLEVK